MKIKQFALIALFALISITVIADQRNGDGSGIGGTGVNDSGSGMGGTGMGGTGIINEAKPELLPQRPEIPERIERPDLQTMERMERPDVGDFNSPAVEMNDVGTPDVPEK